MLHWLIVGLVMLGSILQEGSGTGTAVRRNFCQAYEVVKTFNLRDPVTNEICTLEILSFVCGGFCDSDTVMTRHDGGNSANGVYQLLPETSCNCCEFLQQPLLHDVPPMVLSCEEGHKWNHTVKIPVPVPGSECSCRTCTSSLTVEWTLHCYIELCMVTDHAQLLATELATNTSL